MVSKLIIQLKIITNNVVFRYFSSEGNKATENIEEQSTSNTLKDVGNVIKTQTGEIEKSPFEIKTSEKLTDDSIDSILTESTVNSVRKVSPVKQQRQKENLNNSLKSNSSFKWKPSLADMFGFKSKSLPSSPAVKGGFVSPLSTTADGISSSPQPSEQTPVRRNPFAKVAKAENTPSDIDSQGSSLRESEPDSLTPDVSENQVINFQKPVF